MRFGINDSLIDDAKQENRCWLQADGINASDLDPFLCGTQTFLMFAYFGTTLTKANS